MVNIYGRKCRTEGCGKKTWLGVAGTKTAEYCAQHAPEGMVDIYGRKCRTEGCGNKPSFGVAGTKTGEYCAQHAPDGMVNVCSRNCRTEGCGKQPSFGAAGAKAGEYCAQHAPDGMVNVCSKKRRTEGCGKRPLFGATVAKAGCAQHAPDGMINVCSRKCRTEGCGKQPSFGAAGAKAGEYYAQHVRLQCGVEGEVGRHHSGKETLGNIIPSGAKQTTLHPPPPKTSQPSGVSRDSRKRVRHQEITSTASKRTVARESTAWIVIMPNIDGQKYPVKRNSSVKTEVQLSF